MTETEQSKNKFINTKHGRILLAAVIAIALIWLGAVWSGNISSQSTAAAAVTDGALTPDKNNQETVACPDGSFGCTYEYIYESSTPVQRIYRDADGTEIETVDLN